MGVGLCARLSQRRGRDEGRGRRSASRAKAPGTSPGASFLSPLSLAIQRKGARGWRGRAAPEARRGLSSVPRCDRGKPYVSDAARLVSRRCIIIAATRHATSLQTPESPSGRTLAQVGGHSRVGGQLSARPYRERNSQSRQLVEMGFSAASLSRRGTPRRYGLREMELHD